MGDFHTFFNPAPLKRHENGIKGAVFRNETFGGAGIMSPMINGLLSFMIKYNEMPKHSAID